jgi:hypothetical protein
MSWQAVQGGRCTPNDVTQSVCMGQLCSHSFYGNNLLNIQSGKEYTVHISLLPE